MYIPKLNQFNDRTEVLAFLRRFSFATIVTSQDAVPVATHLPFTVIDDGERILLQSHFAKSNPHWQQVSNGRVLVIFSEPHAYISTGHYDQLQNVPTWNYMAVHVYGQASILNDASSVSKVLAGTINAYEPGFLLHWESFPSSYKEKMLQGIVAFEVLVDEIQAKKKLSQNRAETEKARIIAALQKSEEGAAKLIAEYMTPDREAAG